MKANYLLILFFVFFNCGAKNLPNSDKELNLLVDSLFQSKFLQPGAYQEADSLVKKIVVFEHSDSILIRFMETYPIYRNYPLKQLTKQRSPALTNWLNSNSYLLEKLDWDFIIEGLLSNKKTNNDTFLSSTFSKVSNESSDPNIRHLLLYYFSVNGNLKEVLEIANNLQKETNKINRSDILISLTKFHTIKTDSILKLFLSKDIEYELMPDLLEYGIVKFNRYDLLLDLKLLKTKFLNDSNQKRFEIAKESLKILEKTILELEQKKKANAYIGLPP